jgi:hypothetical protein
VIRKRNFRTCFAILVWVVNLAYAEDPRVTEVGLSSSPTVTTEFVSPTFGRPMCSEGTVFIRKMPVRGSAYRSGLTAIASDGKSHPVTFEPTGPPNSDTAIQAFSMLNGRMYQVVRTVTKKDDEASAVSEILMFSATGALVRRTRIGLSIFPSMFVALPNGEFFLAGVEYSNKKGQPDRPFMAMIASDGSIKEKFNRKAPSLTKEEEAAGAVDPAIQEGTAVLGDDTNIYMLEATKPASVAVIASSGRRVRTVKIKPPFDQAKPVAMMVSANVILVQYQGTTPDGTGVLEYVTYDASDGALKTRFRPTFKGSPVCWEDGHRLTVLTMDRPSGKFAVGWADLR